LSNLAAQSAGDTREQLTRAVEKELAGHYTEPHQIIYFKAYRSQIPVIEQALEARSADAGDR